MFFWVRNHDAFVLRCLTTQNAWGVEPFPMAASALLGPKYPMSDPYWYINEIADCSVANQPTYIVVIFIMVLFVRIIWGAFKTFKTIPNHIWINYNVSLTWIKAIWEWFPYKSHDSSEEEQWGRYNLPRSYDSDPMEQNHVFPLFLA